MYIILLTYVTNVVELQILIMSTITKDFPLWIVDSLENGYVPRMYLILDVRKDVHKIVTYCHYLSKYWTGSSRSDSSDYWICDLVNSVTTVVCVMKEKIFTIIRSDQVHRCYLYY